MRMRAIILMLIIVSGTYMMLQSKSTNDISSFTTILNAMDSPVQTVTFIKPAATDHELQLQTIEQSTQIDHFLAFLEHYQLQAADIAPTSSTTYEQFTILLEDDHHNVITILLQDDFVTFNDDHFYEILNGPLDAQQLATFFFQSST